MIENWNDILVKTCSTKLDMYILELFTRSSRIVSSWKQRTVHSKPATALLALITWLTRLTWLTTWRAGAHMERGYMDNWALLDQLQSSGIGKRLSYWITAYFEPAVWHIGPLLVFKRKSERSVKSDALPKDDAVGQQLEKVRRTIKLTP